MMAVDNEQEITASDVSGHIVSPHDVDPPPPKRKRDLSVLGSNKKKRPEDLGPLLDHSQDQDPNRQTPTQITSLEELRPYDIILIQSIGLIVCQCCAIGIRREFLPGHITSSQHLVGPKKVPDNLEALLDHHGIPHSPIPHPESPIAPIPHIPIIRRGYHCTLCTFAAPSSEAFSKRHPDHRNQYRLGPVQVIYRGAGGSPCWKVEPGYSSMMDMSDKQKVALLQAALDYDRYGPPSNGMSEAHSDARITTPFLTKMHWVTQTQGTPYAKVAALSFLPTKAEKASDPAFRGISQAVHGLYKSLKSMIDATDPTIRLQLNSPVK